MAMVRSRKGDFVYTQDDIREMINSIPFLVTAGVYGIVFGSVLKNNEIDI